MPSCRIFRQAPTVGSFIGLTMARSRSWERHFPALMLGRETELAWKSLAIRCRVIANHPAVRGRRLALLGVILHILTRAISLCMAHAPLCGWTTSAAGRWRRQRAID